jgi:hypothetical protein
LLATSAPGLGSPRPHLRRDWAHAAHISTRTGLTPATSAPGLGPPRPHPAGDVAANGTAAARRAVPGHAVRLEQRQHRAQPSCRAAAALLPHRSAAALRCDARPSAPARRLLTGTHGYSQYSRVLAGTHYCRPRQPVGDEVFLREHVPSKHRHPDRALQHGRRMVAAAPSARPKRTARRRDHKHTNKQATKQASKQIHHTVVRLRGRSGAQAAAVDVLATAVAHAPIAAKTSAAACNAWCVRACARIRLCVRA